MEKVKPIKIKDDMKVRLLVRQMENAGFGARKIGAASRVLAKMIYGDCNIFLGLAGAMVPAGMKEIIIDILKTGKVKALVTTGANLTHDLVEALGEFHYHCDSWDDYDFYRKGKDRMYNVFMKNSVYKKIEKFLDKNWQKIEGSKNVMELIWNVGKLLKKKSTKNSIIRVCYEKKIPVFCPAILDSGLGLMLWGQKELGKSIEIDFFSDLKMFVDICWTCKNKGVIFVCGGTPKNFIQQALQFSDGAIYGIQITTDKPEYGGSSGAPLEEGISWGKMQLKAKKNLDFVNVFCDATIALPLIWASVKKS